MERAVTQERNPEIAQEGPGVITQRFRIGQAVMIAERNGDIRLAGFKGKLLIKGGSLHYFTDNTGNAESEWELRLDGNKIQQGISGLNRGSVLETESVRIVYNGAFLDISAEAGRYETELEQIAAGEDYGDDFPAYRRSPRTVWNVPQEAIEIQNPPEKKEMDKKGLVQIIVSPVIMLCITIAVSILMKRGIYVVISAAGTVISIVMSVIKYISDKRTCREQNEKRERHYEAYLLKIRKQLSAAKQQEEYAYRYHYPSVASIDKMIHSYSSRIYERSHTDDDFLCVSVGSREAGASFPVKFHYDEMALEQDELTLEACRLKERFTSIKDKPVVVDLKKSNLGLVGSPDVLHEQLKLLAAQLTFEQSYHDLELIHIYNRKYEEEFRFLRWYPHCRIHAVNVIGNISSDASRDQILGSIYRILRERQQKTDENNKVSRYLPHYLFVIDEPKLIMDHAIMEYLGKYRPELGFSVIYTSYTQANLPENIGTVVRMESSEEAVLVLHEGKTMNTKFRLQRAGNTDFEWMARDLSVLKHESGVLSQIPESVTFFDMYRVEKPEELDISKRWSDNDSHKTLAVPLGLRSRDEYVYLNLHEKAHGPHGLVAGTTGSGKSELIQSYILSLAVNFHPYEAAFLLIDYKGGGMANLFQKLPHLLGTITNLDGAQSMRALASIKSELARRQRVFGQYDVNHINDYNKLYKAGEADEPIPHLFIISDEFAELKKEQPEFMTELVSAARIGRSLGVHLILATQKPSGVVDDQIWTNSKFRMALKVQNEADSKEILHTPDAANITQPGRAYLQVGNNEIYELFQSAWSGAAYSRDKEDALQDDRVYRLNDLGQRELVNSDLSGSVEKTAVKATQLDVTVEYIHDLFAATGQPGVKKPWLPPLESEMISPYIRDTGVREKMSPLSLCAALGLVDIPEQQKQEEYVHDFSKDGNLAIFGASGFGKSSALTTLMLTLAMENPVEKLHFYIVDFGNSALLPLRELPHTADYIGMDDSEKLKKFMRLMEQEVKARKKLLSKSGAVNFDMYNRIGQRQLPALLWCMDNYDVLKEIDPEYEGIVNQISRDGAGLGIYLAITASRPGAVRFNVMNNFKTKIALFLIDKMDSSSVVGRTKYPLDEIRGRAFVKQEEVHQMQFYLAAKAGNMIAYVERVREMAGKLSDSFSGERPEGIPMLPEILELEQLKAALPKQYPAGMIPVGLDVEHVKPQFLDLSKGRCIVVGTGQSGKTNLLKLIVEMCSPETLIYLIDTRDAELFEYRQKAGVSYYHSAEEIRVLMEELEALADLMKKQYEEARALNENLLPRQYYAQQPLRFLLVEDWDNFAGWLNEIKYPGAEKLFAELNLMNIAFLVTTPNTKMKGFDAATKWMKETGYGIILGQPSEQTIFSTNIRRQEQPEAGMGYLYEKGKAVKILTAKVETGNE